MLPEAVRDGTPYAMHEERRDPDALAGVHARAVRGLAAGARGLTPRSCTIEEPRRLLDVAGGHGGFSMAMCRRHPSLFTRRCSTSRRRRRPGARSCEQEGFADPHRLS